MIISSREAVSWHQWKKLEYTSSAIKDNDFHQINIYWDLWGPYSWIAGKTVFISISKCICLNSKSVLFTAAWKVAIWEHCASQMCSVHYALFTVHHSCDLCIMHYTLCITVVICALCITHCASQLWSTQSKLANYDKSMENSPPWYFVEQLHRICGTGGQNGKMAKWQNSRGRIFASTFIFNHNHLLSTIMVHVLFYFDSEWFADHELYDQPPAMLWQLWGWEGSTFTHGVTASKALTSHKHSPNHIIIVIISIISLPFIKRLP